MPSSTPRPHPTRLRIPTLFTPPLPSRTPRTQEQRPTATPDQVATVIAGSHPEVIQTSLSPDGNRRAEVVRWECVQVGADGFAYAYEELRLVSVQDGSEQVVETQRQVCGGVGAAGLGVVTWSAKDRYLYYTTTREGSPDGLCWYWYRGLAALELATGEKTPLVEGPPSPDGSLLAFWEGSELVVWSLAGGELARMPAAFPGLQPGPIDWSPDGQALVYIQNGTDYCSFGKSALVRVDLPDFQQTILLESETPSLTYVDWETPTRFRLEDDRGEPWTFAADTQELIPGP